MIRKTLALTLACLMLVALATACGGTDTPAPTPAPATPVEPDSPDDSTPPPPPDPEVEHHIRGYFASTPETIDPQMNSSVDGAIYAVHLFQGLYRYMWDGSGVELGDAESAEVSADGLTWTFKLRSDIFWTDGQPVTAHDYEYAWKRLIDPDTAAPYGDLPDGILLNATEILEGEADPDTLGVTALDEKTLEVKLAGPNPFFEEIAVFPVFYPTRKDIIEANGEGWWSNPDTFITNGPFKAESYLMDDRLVVVPNENYYDVDKVVPTSISFIFLADEDVAYSAFRAGEIEIGSNVPVPEIASLTADGMFLPLPELGTYYLSFNHDRAPYDDPLVRKALTLAIDREYIAMDLMEGTRIPATSYVGSGFSDVAPGSDFREVGGDYISTDYEANKAAAIEALAEAGYPGGEGFPTVDYMYNTSSGHQMVAEAIAKDWEDVLGIKTNLSNQEWAVFLQTRRDGEFYVARNGWIADWNDPSAMLSLFRTGDGNNDCNYTNADFDMYMAESYASGDKAVRMTAMHNAEKVLMDDWGCAPIFYYMMSYMVSPNLHGWHKIPLGYTLLHTAYIAE